MNGVADPCNREAPTAGASCLRRLHDGRALQQALASGAATRAGTIAALRARAVRLADHFHVFSGLRFDAALAEAARADRERGTRLTSDLDGLALTIKGNIPRQGLAWTEGSRLFAGRRARETALAVQRLEAAGAITIGCTTLTELAMYSPDNPFEPVAINPHAPRRTGGGSSSGAGAAAALALGHIHLGTDSGGSIRNPALHCGVAGFKPSHGRWPLDGLPCHVPSLDTLGVIATSVADIVAVDALLAPGNAPARPVVPRLAVPRSLVVNGSDRVTIGLFETALRQISARMPVGEVEIDGWREADAAAGTVSLGEASRAHRNVPRELLDPRLAARLDRGLAIPDREIEAARHVCASFAATLAEALGDDGVLVTPTWPFRAPLIHQVRTILQGRRVPIDPTRNLFVRAANAAGAPAITLPAGFYPGRVPFGVQLMAAPGRDTMLLETARKIADGLVALSDNGAEGWIP